jgi:hypothetical protein
MRELITDYGQFWERAKMFNVKNGRVCDTDHLWPESGKKPPICGPGIYILYRGMMPVYVGKGTAGYGIYRRLKTHAQDWLAPFWDNVSWYAFGDKHIATIEAVESLLVATIPTLLNSAQPGGQLGRRCRLGNAMNDAANTLWKKASDDGTAA